MGLFQLLLRLFFNSMLIGENTLFFGDISAFQTRNCRKPVDTPLRGNVPRSALAVGVDHLFNAVFFRHVRKAAAPIQDARGRVVEEHDEAGIAVITEAQREHGAITDEKARNVVALYAALIGMSEKAGADATEAVRNAGYMLYAYLGGQAKREITYTQE